MSLDADIARVRRQETVLRFEQVDLALAWTLGSRLRELALARGVALGIEVRLSGGTVFLCMMPGTTSSQPDWVRRKRNTVERLGCSSYAVGLMLTRDGTTLEAQNGLPNRDYASHGGSFPLRLRSGECVGAVTVSGAPQRVDHALIVEVLAALTGVALADLQLDPAC